MRETVRVTCAVIIDGQRVFAARRGPGGQQALKWEFPGGKLEAGETEEECLHRELAEELNMKVHILARLRSFFHEYTGFTIELIPFLCRLVEPGHTPLEHSSTGWFTSAELKDLDWAEADVALMKYVLEGLL